MNNKISWDANIFESFEHLLEELSRHNRNNNQKLQFIKDLIQINK